MKRVFLLVVIVCCFVLSFAQQKNVPPKMEKEPTAEELYEKAFDYLNGENGELIDTLKAFEFFEKSSNLGYAPAQCEVAMRSDDDDVALSLLQKAIDQHYNYAYYIMFLTYRNGHKYRDTEKAISYLQKGAELGDVTCQWLMGHGYFNGKDGLAQNGKLAEYWFGKAAAQNHDKAMAMLAYMYDDGKLVKRNIQKANELYRKAAELGNAEAAYNLAYSYLNGVGVDVDNERAFALMKNAAEIGYDAAQHELGMMFANGIGCKKNKTAARYWLKLALKGSDKEVQERARINLKWLDENE